MATAALQPVRAVPFVGQETLKRYPQKSAEAALLPRRRREVVLRQQACEELLGQILGVANRVPSPTDEGIERIPISAAKGFERRRGIRRRLVFGRQHHRPVRGDKQGRPFGWLRGI